MSTHDKTWNPGCKPRAASRRDNLLWTQADHIASRSSAKVWQRRLRTMTFWLTALSVFVERKQLELLEARRCTKQEEGLHGHIFKGLAVSVCMSCESSQSVNKTKMCYLQEAKRILAWPNQKHFPNQTKILFYTKRTKPQGPNPKNSTSRGEARAVKLNYGSSDGRESTGSQSEVQKAVGLQLQATTGLLGLW